MLALSELAALIEAHGDALSHPIAPVRIGGVVHDLDAEPLVMGVVNLSRDSTYRDSIAVSTGSAVRRARIMHAHGAGVIDIGAESTTLRAARVDDADQIRALVPVVEELAEAGIATSVEAYSPEVLAACLQAGASVVNLTGTEDLEKIYALAAEYDAAVVMCYVPGSTAREVADAPLSDDPIPFLLDSFAARLAHARDRGLTQVIIDPGLGFYYANLTDPVVRARHQTRVLLNTFRLRTLGVPVCQALPHSFDLFEEHFRSAEAFFAVIARLGGVQVLRTHEVGRVVAVLRAMDELS